MYREVDQFNDFERVSRFGTRLSLLPAGVTEPKTVGWLFFLQHFQYMLRFCSLQTLHSGNLRPENVSLVLSANMMDRVTGLSPLKIISSSNAFRTSLVASLRPSKTMYVRRTRPSV